MAEDGGTGDEGRTRPSGRGSGRAWRIAPFALVALVTIGWSIGWVLVRDRVVTEMDRALGVEATLGREWTCADRRVGGFPFRIDISCASLGVADARGTAIELGPTRAVAQIYNPRHVIVQSAGPVRAQGGDGRLVGEWQSLEASIRDLGRGTEQLALVASGTRLVAETSQSPVGPVEARADRVELYARPMPGSTNGTVDVVLRADGLDAPALAEALALTSPAAIELQLRAHGVRAASGSSLFDYLETWRGLGGSVDVEVLELDAGGTRVRTTGTIALDEERRPLGQIEASARGLGPAAARLVGDNPGFAGAALVAALGGAAAPDAQAEAPLTPLPPVRLQDGRVFVGPVALPGIALRPLY